MVYEPKTVRLDLDDGGGLNPFRRKDFAVFYQELRHGTQKAVSALTRPFLKYPDGKPPTLVLEGEDDIRIEGVAQAEGEAKTKVEVDLTKIDWDAVNDALIVGQVKEWSFGPVDQETLDGIPESVRGKLVEEANRLYGKKGETPPLPKGGDGN